MPCCFLSFLNEVILVVPILHFGATAISVFHLDVVLVLSWTSASAARYRPRVWTGSRLVPMIINHMIWKCENSDQIQDENTSICCVTWTWIGSVVPTWQETWTSSATSMRLYRDCPVFFHVLLTCHEISNDHATCHETSNGHLWYSTWNRHHIKFNKSLGDLE